MCKKQAIEVHWELGTQRLLELDSWGQITCRTVRELTRLLPSIEDDLELRRAVSNMFCDEKGLRLTVWAGLPSWISV